MATISQIRGMLLEEALLHLLRASGYQTVEKADHQGVRDETLNNGHSGLEVLGRGGVHQIDAVADFTVAQPFSHAQRLLLEAKCYSDRYPVGIEVVRNAVGVLKDVEEYWVSRVQASSKARYHYQYAIFSASEYTEGAEKYAYAQDIYLIPLAKSAFIQPLIQSIRSITHQDFGEISANSINVNMTDLRKEVRRRLKRRRGSTSFLVSEEQARLKLEEFIQNCYQVNKAVLAMIARQFPVFLVPNPEVDISELNTYERVKIYWDENGWYLRSNQGRNLFSFDLPPRLFERYADEGGLTEIRALELKREVLADVQAIVTLNHQIRVLTFELDKQWIEQVFTRLRRT